MNKQYRAEIRDLKRNRRSVERNKTGNARAYEVGLKRLGRAHARAAQRWDRVLGRIDKRIAILEGRLS